MDASKMKFKSGWSDIPAGLWSSDARKQLKICTVLADIASRGLTHYTGEPYWHHLAAMASAGGRDMMAQLIRLARQGPSAPAADCPYAKAVPGAAFCALAVVMNNPGADSMFADHLAGPLGPELKELLGGKIKLLATTSCLSDLCSTSSRSLSEATAVRNAFLVAHALLVRSQPQAPPWASQPGWIAAATKVVRQGLQADQASGSNSESTQLVSAALDYLQGVARYSSTLMPQLALRIASDVLQALPHLSPFLGPSTYRLLAWLGYTAGKPARELMLRHDLSGLAQLPVISDLQSDASCSRSEVKQGNIAVLLESSSLLVWHPSLLHHSCGWLAPELVKAADWGHSRAVTASSLIAVTTCLFWGNNKMRQLISAALVNAGLLPALVRAVRSSASPANHVALTTLSAMLGSMLPVAVEAARNRDVCELLLELEHPCSALCKQLAAAGNAALSLYACTNFRRLLVDTQLGKQQEEAAGVVLPGHAPIGANCAIRVGIIACIHASSLASKLGLVTNKGVEDYDGSVGVYSRLLLNACSSGDGGGQQGAGAQGAGAQGAGAQGEQTPGGQIARALWGTFEGGYEGFKASFQAGVGSRSCGLGQVLLDACTNRDGGQQQSAGAQGEQAAGRRRVRAIRGRGLPVDAGGGSGNDAGGSGAMDTSAVSDSSGDAGGTSIDNSSGSGSCGDCNAASAGGAGSGAAATSGSSSTGCGGAGQAVGTAAGYEAAGGGAAVANVSGGSAAGGATAPAAADLASTATLTTSAAFSDTAAAASAPPASAAATPASAAVITTAEVAAGAAAAASPAAGADTPSPAAGVAASSPAAGAAPLSPGAGAAAPSPAAGAAAPSLAAGAAALSPAAGAAAPSPAAGATAASPAAGAAASSPAAGAAALSPAAGAAASSPAAGEAASSPAAGAAASSSAGAAAPSSAAGIKSCARCGALRAPDGSRLKKCAGCRVARFCSPECQVAAWRAGHKQECARMAWPAAGGASVDEASSSQQGQVA